MLKKVLLFAVCIIYITACDQSVQLIANDASLRSSNLMLKPDTLTIFLDSYDVKNIETNEYSFVGVQDWYDNDTVVYLRDENGYSYLNTFNILTGEDKEFFQINEPIIDIEANANFSIFAIKVALLNGNSDLYFVNKFGEEILILNDVGEDFQLHWNPYVPHELIVVALQPDYTFNVVYLDLNSESMIDLSLEQIYAQWLAKKQLAFLEWDMYEPSYYAPLFQFDLTTKEKQLLKKDIISFFSFHNYFFTISVKSLDETTSHYTFYESSTQKKLAQLQVPILNTYSEQWWVPNHAVDDINPTFYYMKPKKSADLYQYKDGFSLVSFDIVSGEEKIISSFDYNYPMKLSPSGKWLLLGYQLEKLVDINKKELSSLIHW